jgi:predicted Zn-dependent protease
MKRAAVWTIALVGAFFVGFWAGRIPSKPVPEANVALGTDPVIAEYVNRVGQNIAKNSDAKVPFTIKVVQSDDNVVPLPGGFFYVNTGLILESDTIQKR